jgi:acetyl esterase/lipase
MSKRQLDTILRLAEEAPPPESPAPVDMRAWFEEINAQTPVAQAVVFSSLHAKPWMAEWNRPAEIDGERLIIYYHGGGFLFGSPVAPCCHQSPGAARFGAGIEY